MKNSDMILCLNITIGVWADTIITKAEECTLEHQLFNNVYNYNDDFT